MKGYQNAKMLNMPIIGCFHLFGAEASGRPALEWARDRLLWFNRGKIELALHMMLNENTKTGETVTYKSLFKKKSPLCPIVLFMCLFDYISL